MKYFEYFGSEGLYDEINEQYFRNLDLQTGKIYLIHVNAFSLLIEVLPYNEVKQGGAIINRNRDAWPGYQPQPSAIYFRRLGIKEVITPWVVEGDGKLYPKKGEEVPLQDLPLYVHFKTTTRYAELIKNIT